MTEKSSLHIPRPSARPGDAPDFSYLTLSEAGEVRYPDPCTPARDIEHLAHALERVLDDDGVPQGVWAPVNAPDVLLEACLLMLLNRQIDYIMLRMQLQ